MSLPISVYGASKSFDAIMSKAAAIKNGAQTVQAQIAAGPISADVVINILRGLKQAYDTFTEHVAQPGLNAYASLVKDDQNLDFVAETNAAKAACLAAFNWIDNNFPKDANGYLLKDKIVAGNIEARTFSSASMSGMNTVLEQLVATFS